MDVLSEGIARVLNFFYSIIPSYGVAIILLTLAVMIVLTPLTLKGTRSMMAMQQLQPELKKIQAQYKDDREKLNEELLKFYKENNINPIGGCLPLLVQMPVFLVLFQVLRGLTRRAPDLGAYSGWVMGQLGLGNTPTSPPDAVTERMFDPAFLPHDSEMYQALSNSFEMRFLGIDLSESASQALSNSFVHAIPYLILILMVAFTGWFQQRQIQGRNPSAAAQNPQQQMIMKLMPILLPVISFSLPGGLVLYFLVSNGYRIGQQAWITRTLYSPDGPKSLTASKGDGDSSSSGDAKGGAGGKATKEQPAIDASGNGGPKPNAPRGAATGNGKGRATPKRTSGRTTPPKGGSRSSGGKTKKTYTNDPGAKGRSGRTSEGSEQVEPRGRKGKRKRD